MTLFLASTPFNFVRSIFVDVNNLSLNELQNLKKQVAVAIENRFDQEKENLKREVRELVKHRANTSVEELFGFKGGKKRAKATAKYRDGQGNTWSGRGRAPTWLQKKLASGAKKEDFRIK
jgi:DNA-binding protein H-NS